MVRSFSRHFGVSMRHIFLPYTHLIQLNNPNQCNYTMDQIHFIFDWFGLGTWPNSDNDMWMGVYWGSREWLGCLYKETCGKKWSLQPTDAGIFESHTENEMNLWQMWGREDWEKIQAENEMADPSEETHGPDDILEQLNDSWKILCQASLL